MALQNGWSQAFNITPSDTVDFTTPADSLIVVSIAAGATAAVVMPNGTVISFAGLVAGQVLPLKAKRVNTTNTLATLAGLRGN